MRPPEKLTNPVRLSLFWLAFWLGCSALATGLTQSNFELRQALLPPFEHKGLLYLGADAFGRPLVTSVLRGSWVSLGFAAFSLTASASVAILFGISTAFAPKIIQLLFRQFLEFLIGIPGLILALALAAINGPGWTTLLIALILGILPSTARLVQARTRELIMEDYVLAARSLGATRTRIAIHHLGRGLLPVLTAKLPTWFSHCLLAEATLSFLGVGAPLGTETWGSILAQGRDYLLEAPQIAILSGIPLILTLLAVQTLGDRARDGRF